MYRCCWCSTRPWQSECFEYSSIDEITTVAVELLQTDSMVEPVREEIDIVWEGKLGKGSSAPGYVVLISNVILESTVLAYVQFLAEQLYCPLTTTKHDSHNSALQVLVLSIFNTIISMNGRICFAYIHENPKFHEYRRKTWPRWLRCNHWANGAQRMRQNKIRTGKEYYIAF